VTIGLRDRGVTVVLLDIEGTTTPIAFVYEVLFPYARARVSRFLSDHLDSDDVLTAVRQLRREWIEDCARGDDPPCWPDTEPDVHVPSVTAYVEWLMDRDRKSPGLKSLQGQIWQVGYASGDLKGAVFDDVPAAFERWRRDRISTAIYSSGSVLAQRLLFGTTAHGDLTRLVAAFFDTAVGPKASPASYEAIVRALGVPAHDVLFVSDVARELDAASAGGLQTALCVRSGNPDQLVSPGTPVISSFDELV
jgi:enolase-phosphatase E1